jgi:hypothetical protein
MEQTLIVRINLDTLLSISPVSVATLTDSAFVLIDHVADLSIKDNDRKTALDVAKTRDVASKISRKTSNTPAPTPSKLKVLIQENRQQKAEIPDPGAFQA